MKTAIKSLIATSLSAIILSSAVFTTSGSAAEKISVKTAVFLSSFRKIAVKGNVEVTLIQSPNIGVNYADDNTGTAKIVQDGDVLRINSADKNLVKLVIYVDDIYRIEAADFATIKTSGKLTTKFLQIFLKNNAKADIYTSTEGLYTVISDGADLKLSGSTDSHTLVMGKTPKLTIDKFAALKTKISSTETVAVESEIAAIK